MKLNQLWTWVLLIFGAGFLANGAFMLIAPVTWYNKLPAAVPDFGPYNEHFVRDIGCAYVVFGLAGVAGAYFKHLQLHAAILLLAFNGSHSLLHVFDTARGFVGTEHWFIDLPLVHLPVIIFAFMVYFLNKNQKHAGANR